MSIASKEIFRFEAMSTPCELQLIAPKTKAHNTARAILKEVKRLEEKYNFYDPTSYLHALNARTTAKLDTETEWILKQAIEFYHKTQQHFDITIATIKEAYQAKSLKEFYSQRERLLPFVGCHHFTIKRHKLLFDNPHTKIDLGGFVKEYAVDRAIRIAKQHKIEAALINFGGDISLYGATFVVAIKDPNDPKKLAKKLSLTDCAIATSAHYERYVTIEGKRFSHILAPTLSSARSITVIAPTTLEAGIFSTALAIDPCIPTPYRTISLY